MGREWRKGTLIRERFFGVILAAFPVGSASNDWTLSFHAGPRFSVSAKVRI